MNANVSTLTEKIQTLSPEQIAEVEDFVEFIRLRAQERGLARAMSAVSAPAFEAVWNNRKTSPTMPYEFGDVVLVRFPFTS